MLDVKDCFYLQLPSLRVLSPLSVTQDVPFYNDKEINLTQFFLLRVMHM